MFTTKTMAREIFFLNSDTQYIVLLNDNFQYI